MTTKANEVKLKEFFSVQLQFKPKTVILNQRYTQECQGSLVPVGDNQVLLLKIGIYTVIF